MLQTKLVRTAFNHSVFKTYSVFVNRGTCSFSQIGLTASDNGAAGVVIVNVGNQVVRMDMKLGCLNSWYLESHLDYFHPMYRNL